MEYRKEQLASGRENEMAAGEKQRRLMEFLDLRTTREKIDYLQKIHMTVTPEFLEVAALSLDFAETSEDTEIRFWDLIRFLETKEKYEGGRRR